MVRNEEHLLQWPGMSQQGLWRQMEQQKAQELSKLCLLILRSWNLPHARIMGHLTRANSRINHWPNSCPLVLTANRIKASKSFSNPTHLLVLFKEKQNIMFSMAQSTDTLIYLENTKAFGKDCYKMLSVWHKELQRQKQWWKKNHRCWWIKKASRSSQEDVKSQQPVSIPAYVPGVLHNLDSPSKKTYINQFKPLSCEEKESQQAKEERIWLERKAKDWECIQGKEIEVGLCQL